MNLFAEFHVLEEGNSIYIRIDTILGIAESLARYKDYDLKKGEIPPYPGSGLYVERKGAALMLLSGAEIQVREKPEEILNLFKKKNRSIVPKE